MALSLEQRMARAPDDVRQAWLDTIKARVERFEGPLAGFFLMTGPLDEFSERGDLRPVMSTEDFDRLVDQVDVEPSLGVADLLLRVAMIFQPPTGIDPTRLIDVIISRANTAEGELRFQYQQVAFQLAIAWTLSDLAERAAALLPQENQNASSILEQALTVAAAQSAQSEQTNALKRYLLASAVSRPLGESAQALDRALAVLVNGEPRLAVALHDAKLATALAL